MTFPNQARLGRKFTMLGALLAMSFASLPALADRPLGDYAKGAADFEVLVDLKDDTTDVDERAIEGRIRRPMLMNSIHAEDERFFIVRALSEADRRRIIDTLKMDPRVENVEPNARVQLIAPSKTHYGTGIDFSAPPMYQSPTMMERVRKWVAGENDPRRAEQWHMDMARAETAWGWGADGSGIVVAVIDTGVAYEDHDKFRRIEDLAETDFTPGYDFVNDDDHANDDHGHGTHVAGTIAQTTGNGVGVAGLAPGATIMPIKVLSAHGGGTTADIADAIRFATDKGANVINMSLGGGGHSSVLASAVKYAHDNGVFVACAAGNSARGKVEYPAAYPGAFAVSSVGPGGVLAFYSSYGKEIQLAAPGGDLRAGGANGGVLQNVIEADNLRRIDHYAWLQGTSMATPHVAAAAAIVGSAGITDPDKIAEILKDSAQAPADTAASSDKYGAGILDAGAAAEAARQEAGGWKHLGLAGLLVWWFRRKSAKANWQTLGRAGTLVGLFIPVGLFFFGYLGLGAFPGMDILTQSPVALTTNALWQSVLPPLLLTLMLWQIWPARGLLLGITLGWAAYLGVSAFTLGYDLTWMPGFASGWDRSWLGLNALFSLVLARQIGLPERR